MGGRGSTLPTFLPLSPLHFFCAQAICHSCFLPPPHHAHHTLYLPFGLLTERSYLLPFSSFPLPPHISLITKPISKVFFPTSHTTHQTFPPLYICSRSFTSLARLSPHFWPKAMPELHTLRFSLPSFPCNLYLCLPLSVVLLFLVHKLLWKRYRLPPGPRPLPIVGNLYDIDPVRFRCFWEWSKKYGPIMSVWTGSTLNVVISSVNLAKEVLKDKDQQLAARNRTRAANLFSRNGQDLIWADYGPHYVKVRKVCTLELFNPKRLDALRPLREEEVSAMIESIFRDCDGKECEGKTIMLKRYLAAVAFNNITRIAFGKRFVDEEGNIDPQGVEFKEIIAQGMKLGSSMKMSEHIPYIRWMFPFHKEEFMKHGARRDSLTKVIMQEHTVARDKSGGAKQHFVDALLTLQERYDLTETNIIGLLWDMITAGMDTTAISVEWAMAELVRNPRVQQKAQEELDRVVGMDRVINEADLTRLPYLQCVVKESLRLHPPTPLMLPHKSTEKVTVGGYDIPKGSVVHVNVWAIARDPNIWKDPLTFRPERFLEEDVDIKGHDYRLLPFGAGRRACPGAQLGLNLVQLMLARLIHHFSWAPAEGLKVENINMTERPGVVTFMAKPLETFATPRLPAHLYKR